jgi:hypothetical protein
MPASLGPGLRTVSRGQSETWRILAIACRLAACRESKEDSLPRRREQREETPRINPWPFTRSTRVLSSLGVLCVLGGKKEFAVPKMKNGAPAPIGGSMDARSNASRWTQNLADTRLAISLQRIGARGNGALGLFRSAKSRQLDRLAHTNATCGQRFTGGGGRNYRENSNLYLNYEFILCLFQLRLQLRHREYLLRIASRIHMPARHAIELR